MRSLAWMILLALICVCAYNVWATHKLKKDVHEITEALATDGKIDFTPPALPKIKKLVKEAQAHLMKAQEYLVEGNPDDSKLHLDLALEKLEEAKELAEEKLGGEKGLLGEIKGAASQIKETLVKNWPKSSKDKETD